MGILLTPQKPPFYIYAYFIKYSMGNLSNCQATLLVHKARYLIHTGWMSSHYINVFFSMSQLSCIFLKEPGRIYVHRIHNFIMKGQVYFCQYRKEGILLSQKQAILPNQLSLSL